MTGGIDLVCFDWGGVILRICRSWREACDRAGLAVHPEMEDPDRITARRELAAAYQIGRLGCEAFFQSLADSTGGRYSPEEVKHVHDAWLIEEYPGVEALLRRLARERIATGLLSNTNERHWIRQWPGDHGRQHFGAVLHLTHRHASHLMGVAKPAREIYDSFAAEVGVRPESILFFDDLPENVAAARAARWKAERIDPEADTAGQIDGWLMAYGLS